MMVGRVSFETRKIEGVRYDRPRRFLVAGAGPVQNMKPAAGLTDWIPLVATRTGKPKIGHLVGKHHLDLSDSDRIRLERFTLGKIDVKIQVTHGCWLQSGHSVERMATQWCSD